jgi:farnesyl diphosphate synthase
MMHIDELISTTQNRIEIVFNKHLNNESAAAPLLHEAMAYSTFNGGKRLRPLLVYATGLALNAPIANLDAPAAAIELIHTYSLIHDDLPAMDNSDLRRGKPSNHKQFSEAMAILAGDALQTLAFQLLSSHPCTLNAETRINMITALATASGFNGMAAGQVLDITQVNSSEAALLKLYELKTGKLLSAAVALGSLAAPNYSTQIKAATAAYAKNLGLAFQLQDDLLDIECSTAILGKPQGLDQDNQKTTYPALFGLARTRQKIEELIELSIQSVKPLGESALGLEQLAMHLLVRKY